MERWKELWKESEKVREIVEREGLEVRLGIQWSTVFRDCALAVYWANIGFGGEINALERGSIFGWSVIAFVNIASWDRGLRIC